MWATPEEAVEWGWRWLAVVALCDGASVAHCEFVWVQPQVRQMSNEEAATMALWVMGVGGDGADGVERRWVTEDPPQLWGSELVGADAGAGVEGWS